MSTPTSRASLGLLALVALAGCVGDLGGGDNPDAPSSVQVTSDALVIAGPDGFCVDPTSTQNGTETAFVLLGNCAAISGQARAPQPNVAAILTAAVAAPSDGASLAQNLPSLDAYFRSDAGRAVLSRSGDASTVEILETRILGEMFVLHARDTSAGAVVGVAQDYWRIYMDLGARVTTLSLLSLADQDVSDAAALDTLMRFAATVAQANAIPGAGTNEAEIPQGPEPTPARPFAGRLLDRIFR